MYIDAENQERTLAPAGWRCKASIGAMGDHRIVVTPAGADPSAARTPSVEAGNTGTCVGCAIDQVCGLILPASTADGDCPARPSGEVVDHINANTVSLVDPPTADSSYSTVERVAYFPSSAYPEAFFEQCTLPYSQRAFCEAIEYNLISDDAAVASGAAATGGE